MGALGDMARLRAPVCRLFIILGCRTERHSAAIIGRSAESQHVYIYNWYIFAAFRTVACVLKNKITADRFKSEPCWFLHDFMQVRSIHATGLGTANHTLRP